MKFELFEEKKSFYVAKEENLTSFSFSAAIDTIHNCIWWVNYLVSLHSVFIILY